MRGKATELLGLEVAEHEAEPVLQVGELDELLHAGRDLTHLAVANVNLLADQLLTVGVVPDFNDLADSDVKLGDVRLLDDHLSRLGLGLNCLWLLLLLLADGHRCVLGLLL